MSGVAIIAYDDLEIHKLHSLVSAARRRLAGLEAAYTIEKAKVDALQATLFKRLRVHCQERDRLRLVVAYRKQFLEAFLRRDESDLEKVSQEFRNAQSRSDQEYEETASIFLTKKELTAEEEAELGKSGRSS